MLQGSFMPGDFYRQPTILSIKFWWTHNVTENAKKEIQDTGWKVWERNISNLSNVRNLDDRTAIIYDV